LSKKKKLFFLPLGNNRSLWTKCGTHCIVTRSAFDPSVGGGRVWILPSVSKKINSLRNFHQKQNTCGCATCQFTVEPHPSSSIKKTKQKKVVPFLAPPGPCFVASTK
jgi:hypothetical protein